MCVLRYKLRRMLHNESSCLVDQPDLRHHLNPGCVGSVNYSQYRGVQNVQLREQVHLHLEELPCFLE